MDDIEKLRRLKEKLEIYRNYGKELSLARAHRDRAVTDTAYVADAAGVLAREKRELRAKAIAERRAVTAAMVLLFICCAALYSGEYSLVLWVLPLTAAVNIAEWYFFSIKKDKNFRKLYLEKLSFLRPVEEERQAVVAEAEADIRAIKERANIYYSFLLDEYDLLLSPALWNNIDEVIALIESKKADNSVNAVRYMIRNAG